KEAFTGVLPYFPTWCMCTSLSYVMVIPSSLVCPRSTVLYRAVPEPICKFSNPIGFNVFRYKKYRPRVETLKSVFTWLYITTVSEIPQAISGTCQPTYAQGKC